MKGGCRCCAVGKPKLKHGQHWLHWLSVCSEYNSPLQYATILGYRLRNVQVRAGATKPWARKLGGLPHTVARFVSLDPLPTDFHTTLSFPRSVLGVCRMLGAGKSFGIDTFSDGLGSNQGVAVPSVPWYLPSLPQHGCSTRFNYFNMNSNKHPNEQTSKHKPAGPVG
jgi:hypothetical protein